MMHLIHRNRVDHFADFPRNISPLRSNLLANIFPRGEGLFGASVLIDHPFLGALMSLPRWGRGTAAEEKREYLERFSDAVAVDEVHYTDALSHLCKCKGG